MLASEPGTDPTAPKVGAVPGCWDVDDSGFDVGIVAGRFTGVTPYGRSIPLQETASKQTLTMHPGGLPQICPGPHWSSESHPSIS